MTFLNSLLNNLNDVETQYQNEIHHWNSLYFLKNFNQRKCNCFPDDEDIQSICTCTYPLDGYYRKLIQEDINHVLYYLKSKGVTPKYSDLQTNDNGLILSDWNSAVIDIFQLTDEKIEEMKKEHNVTKIRVFAQNYNILRIISGLGGLTYSK